MLFDAHVACRLDLDMRAWDDRRTCTGQSLQRPRAECISYCRLGNGLRNHRQSLATLPVYTEFVSRSQGANAAQCSRAAMVATIPRNNAD